MTDLGTFHTLTLLRFAPQGAYLEGGPKGEGILLPTREVPPGAAPGDQVEVFLYLDSEDRPIATTAIPAAQVGEVAYLKIAAVQDAGIFLDWGLPKDLMLPWSEVRFEQKRRALVGRKFLVCLFRAEDGRIAASARLDQFLRDEATCFQEGDKVSLMVEEPTDLGLRVIVNHRYWGLVHANELFGKFNRGQKLDGYVKALRPDHKLNITLSAPGYGKIDQVSQRVLTTLARRGGFMPVGDRTPAEEIHAFFGISKKVFKQTLGALYRDRLILLEDDGIRLAKGTPESPEAPGV